MVNKSVAIITEGGKRFGLGHVVRCRALYDALSMLGHQVVMFIEGDDTLQPTLANTHHMLMDWHARPGHVLESCSNKDIIIVDSYKADSSFYQAAAAMTKVLAVFDDTNRLPYPTGSILINGVIHASKTMYANQDGVHLLLGSAYQPVRSEFRNQAPKSIKEVVSKILVTVGGNDIRNLIPQLVSTSKRVYPGASIDVVVGASTPNLMLLQQLATTPLITIHVNASAELIRELMQSADLAVSAAGQTLCELACCGVPGISVSVIDNQLLHARAWDDVGCFDLTGEWNDDNFEQNLSTILLQYQPAHTRQEKSTRMQSILDGSGSTRIATYLVERAC